MTDQNGLVVPNLSQVEGDGTAHVDYDQMAGFAQKVTAVDDSVTALTASLGTLSTVSTPVGSGQFAAEISNCYDQIIAHEAGPAIQQSIKQLGDIHGRIGETVQTWQRTDQANAGSLNQLE